MKLKRPHRSGAAVFAQFQVPGIYRYFGLTKEQVSWLVDHGLPCSFSEISFQWIFCKKASPPTVAAPLRILTGFPILPCPAGRPGALFLYFTIENSMLNQGFCQWPAVLAPACPHHFLLYSQSLPFSSSFLQFSKASSRLAPQAAMPW